MIRNKTKPVSVCTGNGKHKKSEFQKEAKELLKSSFLKPDCRIKLIEKNGEEEDKTKPKIYRVIPLHKTIHIVSAAEIHAHKERQRIKRETWYVPKKQPLVKKEAGTSTKKFILVEGLNAVKEIKEIEKVPHWEKFPSVVEHDVVENSDSEYEYYDNTSSDTISDTEIEELEKLILPCYDFQYKFPSWNKSENEEKTEIVDETVGKSSEVINDKVVNEEILKNVSLTGTKDKIVKQARKEKDNDEDEETIKDMDKEIDVKVIKGDKHILVIITAPKVEIKYQEECEERRQKDKNKTKTQTKKKKREASKKKNKKQLSSIEENRTEDKIKVGSADRMLTRSAKAKLSKHVGDKEEKEPQVKQNCGRITRSKTKSQTIKKSAFPNGKIENKGGTKEKKDYKKKGELPVKGKPSSDNGVARGRSVKKKIKINFHDKKNLKSFNDFSLAIDTD